MRKLYNKSFFIVFSILSLLSLFSSCQVGLGNAVDLQAPEISLTSHKDNDSVASTFTLRGLASDNEGVILITVDFEDADIHYQVVPGGLWQKKTSTSNGWENIENDERNFCTLNDNKWEWAIDVDTNERIISKDDTTYSFSAIARDKIGNSGKHSKLDCSLVVDTESPSVSITQPDIYSGTRTSVESSTNTFETKDGNVIFRLLNGELTIAGRIDDSVSFKGLRIDFDDGGAGDITSGTRKSTIDTTTSVESIDELLALSDAGLGDTKDPLVYYTKTLTDSNLRVWSFKVKPEDWATEENGLNEGKHYIRIVSTCLSASNAWERKVLGYFIWYPEADIPWITVNMCDDTDVDDDTKYSCYPGSSISGSCQDDDGIKSLESKIYKKQGTGYVLINNGTKTHAIASENATYSAFAVTVPSENGSYKVELTVTDTYGTSSSIIKYFKTSDVSAPRINDISPSENSCAIVNSQGDITLKATVTDESLSFVALAWLNPSKASDVNNKINYLTGNKTYWNNATVEGYSDSNGNKLYKFDVPGSATTYTINKTLNLYNDLGIDGVNKKLSSQEFIFFASDGISNTVKTLTLTGDTITPSLEFANITLNGKTESLQNGNFPNFEKNTTGNKATITGRWSDKFTSTLVNKDKFGDIIVQWGDYSEKASRYADGSWSVQIATPPSGGTITATLSDFGGNTKTVQTAASIETNVLGLSRIDSLNDDGSYKVGDVIKITLEFTKTTNVYMASPTSFPTLTLNNGGVATYTEGNGTSSHVFEYTVKSSDQNIDRLTVSKINANGAEWKDAAVEGQTATALNVVLPASNLGSVRKICIDKTPPSIEKIYSLTSAGYYKQDSSIILMMKFNEPVTITNAQDLQVKFTHKNGGVNAKTSSSSVSGSQYVLFTYVVADGDNASPLTFDSFIHDNVTVKDNAGNILQTSSWPTISNSFKITENETSTSAAQVVIDTAKPVPPSFGSWNPSSIIFDAGTSFTLNNNNESNISMMEYSLDDGLNWQVYSSTVNITNNGNYKVKARQTDSAGNISDNTSTVDFTIDKGDLLNKITADTVNGSYSTSTSTKVINGKIVFRKNVILPKNATVTLNVGNKKANPQTTEKIVPINECTSSAGQASVFTFTYTITNGDYINSEDDLLDVKEFSFNQVTVVDSNKTAPVSVPLTGEGKRFNENKTIKVLTGIPEVESISFTGVGTDAVLEVTYDRNISTVGGNIEFVYDTSLNDFHIPAVLTETEYQELKNENATVMEQYYEIGTNGATVENNTLKNDTSTKYILKVGKSDSASDIVKIFTDLSKHKVTIPVVSDSVSATGNKLTVTLGEAYVLPVKGAKYKLTIDAGAVSDSVSNVNAVYNNTVTSLGVESPDIRIVKPSYTISNAGNLKTASVDMSEVQTATMYLSCRTPGATIKYATSQTDSSEVIVHSNPINISTTKTGSVSVPATSSISNVYSEANPVKLGSSMAVNTCDAAKGLKIGIAARAEAGSSKSEVSYEFAARTVVKLVIEKYEGQDAYSANVSYDDGTTVKLNNYRPWIMGGDSTYGPNMIDTFPLAWADTSKYQFMAGSYKNSNSMLGKWWWVSWDINATTYIGFMVGDVPSDANTNGPKHWVPADYAWVLIKDKYPLYPGETLVMAGNNDSVFPVGASLSFGIKKKSMR